MIVIENKSDLDNVTLTLSKYVLTQGGFLVIDWLYEFNPYVNLGVLAP